jgi:hypothetical protein
MAIAVLVAVLAVALWWRRRWRQQRMTPSHAASGRWPWQRAPGGPSPGAGPSAPVASTTPIRDGTRR